MPSDIPQAEQLLRSCCTEVYIEERARRLTAQTSGLADMTRIAGVIADSGISVDDLGLKRPSLDDVFLHLTGHRGRGGRGRRRRRRRPASPRRHCDDDRDRPDTIDRTRPVVEPRGLIGQSLTIVWRNLVHIKRMPEMLLDVTIQPVMFVLLFAFVFGGSIAVPGRATGSSCCPGSWSRR